MIRSKSAAEAVRLIFSVKPIPIFLERRLMRPINCLRVITLSRCPGQARCCRNNSIRRYADNSTLRPKMQSGHRSECRRSGDWSFGYLDTMLDEVPRVFSLVFLQPALDVAVRDTRSLCKLCSLCGRSFLHMVTPFRRNVVDLREF